MIAIYCGSREEECLPELQIVSQKGNYFALLRKFMGNFIDNSANCGKITLPFVECFYSIPRAIWKASAAIFVENTLWS